MKKNDWRNELGQVWLVVAWSQDYLTYSTIPELELTLTWFNVVCNSQSNSFFIILSINNRTIIAVWHWSQALGCKQMCGNSTFVGHCPSTVTARCLSDPVYTLHVPCTFIS